VSKITSKDKVKLFKKHEIKRKILNQPVLGAMKRLKTNQSLISNYNINNLTKSFFVPSSSSHRANPSNLKQNANFININTKTTSTNSNSAKETIVPTERSIFNNRSMKKQTLLNNFKKINSHQYKNSTNVSEHLTFSLEKSSEKNCLKSTMSNSEIMNNFSSSSNIKIQKNNPKFNVLINLSTNMQIDKINSNGNTTAAQKETINTSHLKTKSTIKDFKQISSSFKAEDVILTKKNRVVDRNKQSKASISIPNQNSTKELLFVKNKCKNQDSNLNLPNTLTNNISKVISMALINKNKVINQKNKNDLTKNLVFSNNPSRNTKINKF